MRTILLSCGDNRTNLTKGVLGQEVHCFKCNQDVVILAISDTYSAKCNVCPFGQNYDTHTNAERGMTLHLRKHNDHSVTLYHGNEPVTVRKNEQIELPLYEDTITRG